MSTFLIKIIYLSYYIEPILALSTNETGSTIVVLQSINVFYWIGRLDRKYEGKDVLGWFMFHLFLCIVKYFHFTRPHPHFARHLHRRRRPTHNTDDNLL